MEETTSILNRFNSESEEADYHHGEDYKPFGASRHAVSVNLIQCNGNQIGIAWSLFCSALYDPSVGIEIEFTHKRVSIKGCDLLKLYHSILGNRTTFIAEADRATTKLFASEKTTVVTELKTIDRTNG